MLNQKKSYPLMESFLTLQGEGLHNGKLAYFLRLGGCDVGCVWCDVKESWEAEKHPMASGLEMVNAVKNTPAQIVVVTGGEPLMYDLKPLTDIFEGTSVNRHIETSGVYPLTGEWEWVCFSPKKFKKPLDEYYHKSNELKVVIYHKSDLEWAEGHAAKCDPNMHLLLQPEWSKKDEMIPLIVDYIKEHPKWRISLQTHKYMDVP